MDILFCLGSLVMGINLSGHRKPREGVLEGRIIKLYGVHIDTRAQNKDQDVKSYGSNSLCSVNWINKS